MELNELKNTWTTLEKQLKKNETLNKQLLLGMLHKKSDKSLNKLVNMDFIGIIIGFLVIPAAIWLYFVRNYYYGNLLSVKILSVVLVAVAAILIIWYYFKLKHLKKIDFSKSIKENMSCVTKYAIMVKQEKMASYFILTPVLYFLGIYCYYELKADVSYWTLLIVAFIVGVILAVWSYKKIYDTNIQSIKLNLGELKELEEDID